MVAIASSAGGVAALSRILGALPRNFPAAVAVTHHRPPNVPSFLIALLQKRTDLRVKEAARGDLLRPSTVYVAPAELHLVVQPDRTLGLTDGQRIRGVLSSANPLFTSAAKALGRHVVAVVLTGFGSDATDGVQSVKAAGGKVIAEHPETAKVPSMPLSAIKTGDVDYIVPLDETAPMLMRVVGTAPVTATPLPSPA